MAVLFRWLLRIATGLVVVLAGAALLIYWFASRSLIDYDAREAVAGISAPVEIVRDHAGVPHIFGSGDPDVFFGLGYAHAQDRFWQMTMLRRTVQGRLSELFGPRTVPIDALLKHLDLYGIAGRALDHQDEDARMMLEAYAEGVNAWIGEVNEGARGRGAPEMWLFNHPVARWTPQDSVAILKLMALQLNAHLSDEVLRARVSLWLDETGPPPERLADIMPDVPGTGTAALPRYASLVKGAPRFAQGDASPRDPLSPFWGRELAGASNGWAAGPSRSATGSTLLANDPHLGLTAPSIWYLARLELSSGGVIGGTIPGLPLVLTGRSEDIGWGITSSYLDDTDIHIEEVNPADASQYRGLDGWEEFETAERIIFVRGAEPVTVQIQRTVNGTVLPPDQFDLATIRPAGHVTSVAWTALAEDDTTTSAGLRIMRARNVREALDAAALYVAPSQMLTVADRNRVALKLVGRMPLRDPEHQSLGRLPTPGYLPQNRWQGYGDYADNPEWVAPAGGLVGNTNNKILEAPFPDHVSFFWGDSQRIERWRFLMQEREVHTRDSFVEAQLDTVSYTARSLLPLVGADLWFTGESAPDGTAERQRQRALALLAEWNGEMNEHMPEPLIYAAWMRALQDRLIRDELGPLADEFTHLEPLFIERVFRDVDGARAWCDVIQSAPEESCTDIARIALDDALVWIGETWGSQLESLRWGDAHEAVQDHPTLGEVPVLNWFVNIRQSTSGGDNTLMRGRTSGDPAHPFRNVHAAGYRGVYDFADPDSSVFVTSTGQSGHFLSPHYDDLGELWRRGEYLPMSLDPALARAAGIGTTVLVPEE